MAASKTALCGFTHANIAAYLSILFLHVIRSWVSFGTDPPFEIHSQSLDGSFSVVPGPLEPLECTERTALAALL
jgi:hypothetical protein